MNSIKKKVFLALMCVTQAITSCSKNNQEEVNKLADEVCEAMQLITNDPMSSNEAETKLNEINSKKNEFTNLTQEQLISALEERCPEGALKFKKLANK